MDPVQDSIESDVVPPDRSSSSSAPPALQLASESLFAFRVEYAKIFSDIRAHEDYVHFYESNKEKRALPPPLEVEPFLYDPYFQDDDGRRFYNHRYPGSVPNAPTQSSSTSELQNPLPQYHGFNTGGNPLMEQSYLNQQFQQMHLGNNNHVPNLQQQQSHMQHNVPHHIHQPPPPGIGGGLWGPLPRKTSPLSIDTYPPEESALMARIQDSQKDFLNSSRFHDVPYSSSPSTQTALNTVQFIWRDEEQNAYEPSPSSMSHHGGPQKELINIRNLESQVAMQGNQFSMMNAPSISSNVSGPGNPSVAVGGPSSGHRRLPSTGGSTNVLPPPGLGNGRRPESPPSDEETPSPRSSNVLCRYYAGGYCSRGDKCFYSHDPETATLPPAEPTKPETPMKGNKTQAPAPGPSNASTASAIGTPSSKGTASSAKVNNNPPGTSSRAAKGSVQSTTSPAHGTKNTLTVPSPTNGEHQQGHRRQPSDGSVSPRGVGAAAGGTTAQGEFFSSLEQLVGRIYSVSKDQQGCRFLQKKLEEQEAGVVEAIFNEVYDHITELMTDPFGNYLCQKLLEHCNDQQRFLIVQRVAPDLVYISKNMHGTRAVQKMIECLSSPGQIELIKKALANSVVELIQDLNGNHVIQRCLNRLNPEDNQFIYDAVTTGNNCVQVATHRHGCCVLQRCIDHASTKQKIQLLQEIAKNSLSLVQDAYGNYVVQYVLDLPFPDLVDNLVRTFFGNIRVLATQKFSSNVIEKCLGVCSIDVRHQFVRELLSEKQHFLQLLQDPFANYVIQTALTIADAQQHVELVDTIRPFLAQLRNTPYGKRIQSKIAKETGERAAGKR